MLEFKIMMQFLLTAFIIIVTSSRTVSFSYRQSTVCVIPDFPESAASTTIKSYLPPYCHESYNLSNFSNNIQNIVSYTEIVFLRGRFELSTPLMLNNLSFITLKSEDSSSYAFINCTNSSGGLIFENMRNLKVVGFTFHNCWAHVYMKGVEDVHQNLSCSMAFLFGSTLIVINTTITYARTGICVHNIKGQVKVSNLKVDQAASRPAWAESGNVIVFTPDHHDNSSLLIENSNFSNSGAGLEHTSCKAFSTSAGGLVMFLKTSLVAVYVNNSFFVKNHGCSGGSMLLYLNSIDAFQNPALTLHNVTFSQNRGLIGGGIYVSFEETFASTVPVSTYIQHSIAIAIHNCTFEGNFAYLDGGGIYVQWKESISNYSSHTYDAVIKDCIFKENTVGLNGSGGLAIHFRTYIESQEQKYVLDKVRVNLYVADSTFMSHKINNTKKHSLESSVILAKSVPYLSLESVNVSHNNCTAILAISSTIIFSGDSIISHNSALAGAGLRLCSESLLYFSPHMSLVVTQNRASTVGGGILVNSKCLVNKPMCFYQFTKRVTRNSNLLDTVNVTVKENFASKTGYNLYGGSIDYCYFLYIKTTEKVFKSRLNITPNSKINLLSISSDPQQVCFVNSHNFECNKNEHRSIYAGQRIQVTIKLVGQLNGSVPGIVTMLSGERTAIYKNDITKHILKYDGQNIIYEILSASESINTNLSIPTYLDVDTTSSSNTKYSRQFSPAVLSIKFKKCPLGFLMKLVNNSNIEKGGYACNCSKIYFDFIRNCSLGSTKDPSVFITKFKGSWIGSDGVSLFYSSKYCPLDYCRSSNVRIMVVNDKLLHNLQCKYNREGMLCGTCKENMSLILGNNECRVCSNVYLLLTIPFAIAGLALVALISWLDLTVTTGSVNGLIFYANVIQINSIELLAKHPVPILTPILQLFIAWLNLDVGIPVCFYNGMTAFTKTLLQGVFPIYLWIIAIVIIVLSRRYVRVTRLVGENAIKVLATLILLSYNKMLQVMIGSLNTSTLRIYDVVSGKSHHKIRWILDGTVPYFDFHSHMILVVLSVLFVLVSFPFTLCLLCIKYSYSLSNYCKVFSRINKLKPFFDAYTGPFKDNSRFWPGLLLTIRVFLLLSKVIVSYKFNVFYYVAVLCCLMLLAIIIILNGVYKSRGVNILESLLILNLIFVCINMLVFQNHQIRKVINNISISITLLMFFGIMVARVYDNIVKKKSFLEIMRGYRRIESFDTQSVEGMRGYEEVQDSNDEENFNDGSDIMVYFPPRPSERSIN